MPTIGYTGKDFEKIGQEWKLDPSMISLAKTIYFSYLQPGGLDKGRSREQMAKGIFFMLMQRNGINPELRIGRDWRGKIRYKNNNDLVKMFDYSKIAKRYLGPEKIIESEDDLEMSDCDLELIGNDLKVEKSLMQTFREDLKKIKGFNLGRPHITKAAMLYIFLKKNGSKFPFLQRAIAKCFGISDVSLRLRINKVVEVNYEPLEVKNVKHD